MLGSSLKGLRIGNLFAKIPIVQGGMGVGISLSGLAAATANAGGVGVIAAAAIGLLDREGPPDFLASCVRVLRREIRRARELTRGILGVNIMVALSNFAELVRTAVEEKIDIIFSGAGLPMNLPELVKGSATKIAPIVSSGRAAALILKRWWDKYSYVSDAVVVEGPMAGGHLGFKRDQLADSDYSLERILVDVMQAVRSFGDEVGRPIPVIAGGGVYTGADIRRILDLGASGVQMATRFVATEECDASPAFKQAFVDAREGDLEIISSPVGMPGRAIRNDFLRDVESGLRKPFSCPFQCISNCDYKNAPYCISLALLNAQKGRMDKGFAFAGQNAHRVGSIVKVQELVDSLVAEYEKSGSISPPA